MLLNNLYHIQSLTESNQFITCVVGLESDHAIFKGHFPGQPVLPGVCMMEMITEIAGLHRKNSYRISAAPLIKFLQMIDPGKNPQIIFEIKLEERPDEILAQGKIFHETSVFMKFQMSLLPVNPVQ